MEELEDSWLSKTEGFGTYNNLFAEVKCPWMEGLKYREMCISDRTLVARITDAFVDPTVGLLSDRTKTRFGKYRPWVLWTALPFMVRCV